MARKRKTSRPADPAQIARRRLAERQAAREPSSWGLETATLRLAANADVEGRPGPGGKLLRARRLDIFDHCVARGRMSQSALDAVRRLQADVAALHRTLAGGGDLAPRVDRSRRADVFAGARLAAGERIAAVLALTGAASARLLSALVEAEVVLGQPAGWRTIVAEVSGERLADAQGAALRAACENLAGAYARLDQERRAALRPYRRGAAAP